MNPFDVPVHYGDDARSVHVLVRVTDPDTGDSDSVLIDNLTSAIALIHAAELRIVEESIGFHKLGDDVPELLRAWRSHASGSDEETLLILTHGDPSILDRIQEESGL